MTYARLISAAESEQFAALSGDRNPIHSDPVAARRLPYGTTIVHGAHTLCISLDTWCRGQAEPVTLTNLTADFRKPVFFGDMLEISISNQSNKIILRAKIDRNIVMKAECTCTDNARERTTTSSALPPVEIAATWTRSRLLSAAGIVPVMVDPSVASKLFPDFIRVLGLDILAVLLATSRVVGMHCPGKNSLFTALQLVFDPNRFTAEVLNYCASNIDARFDILDVNLSTRGVTGSAQCHLLQALE